ncbi:MAG: hypothetical protein IKC05_01125 [Lentisphaeria bacterium]|nr:hypothetical protein [Lentisphaeria bacterium]
MFKTRNSESGQVLLAGIIMMTILIMCILYMFDVHNVLRGKIKLETGQQAAALTGASWHRNSLNLIGEINIFKACSALLEGEEHWNNPLPEKPKEKEPPPAGTTDRVRYDAQMYRRRKALQGRIDLLTEMQTRVSFIGPLIGFASAQQAAAANGLPRASRQALESYLQRVLTSYRYSSQFGGAQDVINNYRWRDPYITLLSEISANGVAVYPNVRAARAPITTPAVLALEQFYLDILRHSEEIASGDPPEQSTWIDTLREMALDHNTWNDAHFDGKWWHIDFTLNKFPDESEIFSIGVRNGFSQYSGYSSYDDNENAVSRHIYELAKNNPEIRDNLYRTSADLPGQVNMKWFCYDESWYPEYYRAAAVDYDANHYDYWFNRQALRQKVKSQYIYEGPAAYVESSDVSISRVVRQTAQRSVSNPLRERAQSHVVIGPKHAQKSYNENYATDFRPGGIAKTLGELANGNPPTAIPLVMPVFDKVVLMPTYMPIPYGFSVLRDYQSMLDDFLNWLAAENSIKNPSRPLPEGGEYYLDLLKQLLNRKTFLNYGFNPGCSVILTEEMLDKWKSIRSGLIYSQKNLSGLGWLQEPKNCTDPFNTSKPAQRKIQCTDYINGGMAWRIYESLEKNNYFVIDSNGKIITNNDIDPTIRYNFGGIDGPGGPSFGRPDGKPDLQKGPPRL